MVITVPLAFAVGAVKPIPVNDRAAAKTPTRIFLFRIFPPVVAVVELCGDSGKVIMTFQQLAEQTYVPAVR